MHVALSEAPAHIIDVGVNATFGYKEIVQSKVTYCGLFCSLTLNWVNNSGKIEVSLQVLRSDTPLLPKVNFLHVFIKPWHAVYGFNVTTGGYSSGAIETFVSDPRRFFLKSAVLTCLLCVIKYSSRQ